MKKIVSIALLLFGLQTGFAQTIDRSKQPEPGPAPIIKIQDPVIFKLANGITVLVVEDHTFPKVNASFSIDRGPVYEGDKAGVLSIMGGMLNEGSMSITKEKFDAETDLMGANVGLSSGGGGVSALTRYFKPAFLLFADALKNPAFKEASFDKLKQQTLQGIKSTEKSAAAIGGRMVSALSYGKNTALGEFATAESVGKITLQDVKDAYKNYMTPSRSYLVFTGDITPAEAKKIATETLGTWKGKTLTFPTIVPVKNVSATEINFVDVPSAVQAQIYVTNLIENKLSNPDYFALALTNQILGGGFEGKLFTNLREKRGFTYGSYSSIGNGRFQSLVNSNAQVRNEKVDSAVAEILIELKNMQEGNFTQADLNLAKAKYNGSFALGMENPALGATYATNILINNLPKDFYKTFLQKINAVTLADIKRVSQKYVSTDKARILIVGKAEQIMPNLTWLKYPIKSFDSNGNPVEAKAKEAAAAPAKVDANITAEKVIANYINAIGGMEKIKNITSYSADVAMEMMGRTMEGTMKKMAPYSNAMEIVMGGMSVYKMSFDGTKGYQGQMGQNTPFGEDEIKMQKDEKGIFPQLYYTDADYRINLAGTAKVNGEDTYKIMVTKPSGNVATEYYSVKTGLLLKQETKIKAQGQEVEQIFTYADYKAVDGIMTPMSITQNAAGQEIPLTLSNVKYNSGVTAEDFK